MDCSYKNTNLLKKVLLCTNGDKLINLKFWDRYPSPNLGFNCEIWMNRGLSTENGKSPEIVWFYWINEVKSLFWDD